MIFWFETLNDSSIDRLQTRCGVLWQKYNFYVAKLINQWSGMNSSVFLKQNAISFFFHDLTIQSLQDFFHNFYLYSKFESAKYIPSLSLSAVLANRKHLGVALPQIIIGLQTFSPSASTKNATVILYLDFFPSLLFFPFWAKPLVDKA